MSPAPLAQNEHVLLRDWIVPDAAAYVRWQTSGEWRYYDAPWEGISVKYSPAQERKAKGDFFTSLDKPLPTPRKRAAIALPDNTPIGWVSRYGNDRFPKVWYIGIDICEDEMLNSGLGTHAVQLWFEYLFDNSTIHKIEIHTWSLNPRMMRVAEKLGFTYEGRERELIHWQREWLDRVRYGMLRTEWEEKAQS